jgi:hypothetical protein
MDPFDESGGAALDAFTSAIESDPAAILQPIPQLGNLAKSAVKVLYDHQAQDQHTTGSAGCLRGGGGGVVLPELYVDGFDAEQIWLQLDLAIKPALKRARKLLSKAGQDPVLLTREAEDALDGGRQAGVVLVWVGVRVWVVRVWGTGGDMVAEGSKGNFELL